jgi:hypothetical protein
VICIENSDYPASLERRKIYEALPDPDAEELGQVRIIDESGGDYLFPATCFIDPELDEEAQAAVANAA